MGNHIISWHKKDALFGPSPCPHPYPLPEGEGSCAQKGRSVFRYNFPIKRRFAFFENAERLF